MQYKYLSDTVVACIDDDGISRSSMLASALPEGAEVLPADPVVPDVPQEVTRYQALAALHLAGLLEQVEAIMAAPETSVLTKLCLAERANV